MPLNTTSGDDTAQPKVLAWLVDLDGTLYRPLRVIISMAPHMLLRPGKVRIVRAFRREHEGLRVSPPPPGVTPYEAQLQRTAKKLDLASDEVRATVEDYMFTRPGRYLRASRRKSLISEIEAFRAQGGKSALVTDYPATTKLRDMQLAYLFDEVVANGEPGGPSRLKPDPEGYLSAAERLGVPPAQCLVIGDRADADGEAARTAGMRFRLIK